MFNELPLDKNFKISIDDYNQSNGGIIFPNPNAPTGVGLSRHDIIKLLELNSSSVVIIDEAYIDYANNSREGADEKKVSTVVDLTHKYKKSACDSDNVKITRFGWTSYWIRNRR